MRYATRRPALALLLALSACGGRPATDGEVNPAASRPTGAGSGTPSLHLGWRIDTLNTEGRFRAAGFGPGDTIWGLDRGRVAFVAGRAPPVRLEPIAWDVQLRRGEPTWLDDAGLWARSHTGPTLLVPRTSAPGDYLGPDVLWAPNGQRALLTWTGEGPVMNAVLEDGALRWLKSSMPGLGGASSARWLDDHRVVLTLTRWAPLSGPGSHRETGYRGDLAVLDVLADSIRMITSVRDGEWLNPAGVLVPEGLLAGVRTGGGDAARHVVIDTALWTAASHDVGAGRAAADLFTTAVLRRESASDAGGEPQWRLDLAGTGDTIGILRLRGHSVRTIWYGHNAPRLLVVQESEEQGNRAWVLHSVLVNRPGQ